MTMSDEDDVLYDTHLPRIPRPVDPDAIWEQIDTLLAAFYEATRKREMAEEHAENLQHSLWVEGNRVRELEAEQNALAAHANGLQEKLDNREDALTARCERLRVALLWYADEATWSNVEMDKLIRKGGFFSYGIDECPIAEDGGNRARAALKEDGDG